MLAALWSVLAAPGKAIRRLAAATAACLIAALGLVAITPTIASAAPGLTAGTVVFNSAWQASLYSERCADNPAPVGTAPCKTFTLVFTNPMPASLSPGQVLASATSAKLPQGLLVKVTSVSAGSATTTVQASAATPADAYTGTVGFNVPLSGAAAAAAVARAPTTPGVKIVPAGRVPPKVRAGLVRRGTAHQGAAAAATGTCPATRTGLSGGWYFEITDLNIPVGPRIALNVQGWGFMSASAQMYFYQPGDPSHPGIRAQFTENNYTDFSLYITPMITDGKGNSVLAISKEVPLAPPILLPPIDIQVGLLPVVIVPSISFKAGFRGEIIAGLGYDVEGGDEGFGTSFLMHTDGSVTQTPVSGTLKGCANLGGPSGNPVTPTAAGVKVQGYLTAQLALKFYDIGGLSTGPAVFIEDWLTALANSDTSCAWPAFENDLFGGVEWEFEFSTPWGDYNLGAIGIGWTAMVSFSVDPCGSAAPPGPGPGPTPTGWVVGHAAHAGNDYPYEGLGLFERHEGTDPWNEFYGQCDSFAAWKVYENLAGSNAQHPPYRPDKGWAPTNAGISPVFGNADPSRPTPSGKLTWPNAMDWGRVAAQANYRVDGNPSPGSIAYWTMGQFGHVAYVTDVYPNGTIRVEGYNLRLNGEYSTLVMDTTGAWDSSFGYPAYHVNWPDGFVHIGDGSAGPPQTYPATTSYPQGTYGPGSPEFSLAGSAYPGSVHGWYTRAGHGLIGDEQWTNTNGTSTPNSTATWAPTLAASACYAISVFVPDNYANGVAHYTVTGAQTWVPQPVNQESYTNAWVPLGVFQADSGGHLKLMVSDVGPAGFYIAADAAQYVPASCHGIGPIGTTIDPSAPAGEFTLYGSAYPGSDHGWYTSPGHGLYGNERWTHSNGATPDSSADWMVQLNASQCYAVSAYIPDTYANALASYTVFDANGPHSATIDQSVWTNQFVSLGTYHADANGFLSVSVSDAGQTGYYVAADAMQFLPTQDCGAGGPTGSPGYPQSTFGPGSPQFSTYNWWATQSGHGLIGKEMWTHTNGSAVDSRALWVPHLVPNGCYTISAYVPDNYANNPQTHYTVMDANSSGTSVIVNQQNYTNGYALLGNFRAQPDGSLDVLLTDVGPAGYYVAADAMQYAPADSSLCQTAGGPASGGGYPAGTYGPGSSQFSTTNWWSTHPGHGLTGQMLWTHTNGTNANSTASWAPLLSPNRCYVVDAYVPDNYANNTQTHYYIWANTITPRLVIKDQSQITGWTNLGSFTTYPDGSILVEVTDQGPDTTTYTAADAMRFTPC
ncbi:MAG TPA: CHAP domain-containing protein [Streptosporangiaceae bacterium]